MGLDWNSNKDTNDDQGKNRIESEVVFERNSLIIGQNFCVNATIGGEQKLIIEEDTISENTDEGSNFDDSSVFFLETEVVEEAPKNQDYTLIYAAPASSPMRAPLLMTVIARNLSENDVLISIEDDEEVLVEEIVPANSELALTAQNALFIRALALAASQVQFFISVYHQTNAY